MPIRFIRLISCFKLGGLVEAGEGGEVDHVDFLVGEVGAEEVAGLELEAVAEALQGLLEHLLVVEGQRGQLVDGEPAGHAGIIAALDVLDAGEGEIGDRDDAFARVAIGRGKGSQLLDVGHLQAGLLEQFATCAVGSILVDVEEAARERPTALVGLAAALDEQHVEVESVIAEHDTVGRHGGVRISVTVVSFHSSQYYQTT